MMYKTAPTMYLRMGKISWRPQRERRATHSAPPSASHGKAIPFEASVTWQSTKDQLAIHIRLAGRAHPVTKDSMSDWDDCARAESDKHPSSESPVLRRAGVRR